MSTSQAMAPALETHKHFSPGTPWDIVVTAFVGIGCLLHIIGSIILLKYRKWNPIQTRGVFLTTLSSVGGLIWVASTIVVLRLFARPKGSILSRCSLWTFWLWACFGFGLWLNCLTVRMLQLYMVFKRRMFVNKPHKIKQALLPLLALLSPSMIISLCATVTKAIRYNPAEQNCKFQDGNFKYAIAIICLIPIYFLIFLWFAFQLRDVMAQWNEFRQIRIGGIMSFFLFLLSLVTLQSRVYFKPAGRCFLTLAVAGAVFYYFWARNWEVIYHVLFNKRDYELQFGRELNRFSEPARSSNFEANHMERLVLTIKEEARQHWQEIELLQREVAGLREQQPLKEVTSAA